MWKFITLLNSLGLCFILSENTWATPPSCPAIGNVGEFESIVMQSKTFKNRRTFHYKGDRWFINEDFYSFISNRMREDITDIKFVRSEVIRTPGKKTKERCYYEAQYIYDIPPLENTLPSDESHMTRFIKE